MHNEPPPGRQPGDARAAFEDYWRTPGYQEIRDTALRGLLPSREEQEDCAQLADLKVFRAFFVDGHRLPSYAVDPHGQPASGYVYTIVRRTALDRLRVLARDRSELGGEAMVDVEDRDPSADPASAADLDRVVAEYAGANDVVARDLRLLVLRTAGYTYEEMGRMLFPEEVGEVPAERLAERVRRRVEAAIDRLNRGLRSSLAS